MKHVHYDLIMAWAAGAEIEILYANGTWGRTINPGWNKAAGYRIKPKRVTKTGWINILEAHCGGTVVDYQIYSSKISASPTLGRNILATIPIIWEEDV